MCTCSLPVIRVAFHTHTNFFCLPLSCLGVVCLAEGYTDSSRRAEEVLSFIFAA